jgi:hypothetical protein
MGPAVRDRLARLVGQQVLLRHVGDVVVLRVLGEQVVERLVLAGRISSGIEVHHSSVLANTGSTSKITPRNGNRRCLTYLTDLELGQTAGGGGVGHERHGGGAGL